MSRGPYSDADLGIDPREDERREMLADARAEAPRRACPHCLDRGCPACWGDDEQCECDMDLTLQEIDTGKCQSCGKAVPA